jgi:hypothetical protein
MAEESEASEVVRLVTLCPPALIEAIDRRVARERVDNPGATRSLIVRQLLKHALEAPEPVSAVRGVV